MKHSLLSSLALAIVSLLAEMCDAQIPLDQPLFHPGIRSEEFEQVVDKLGFEDETTEALFRALYEESMARHAVAASAAHERFEAVQDAQTEWRRQNPAPPWQPPPDSGWQEAYGDWIKERESLEAEFESDIDALLGAEQGATWRRITQGVRRERALAQYHHFTVVWAVDLEAVLDAMGISIRPESELATALNQWSNELDQSIERSRDEGARYAEWLRTANLTRFEEMSDEMLHEYLKESRPGEAAVDAIGEAARRGMLSVAAALGEDDRLRFLAATERAAFPTIFNPSPVELFAARLESLTLNANVCAEVQQMVDERYAPRQDSLRKRLIRAYEDFTSPAAREARWERMLEYRAQGVPDWYTRAWMDHPALPIWIENRQLSLDTCKQIRALIPAEEFAALPFSVRLWLSWWEES